MLPWLVAALAVEGMWLPEQLPDLAADLAAAGVTLTPAELSDYEGDVLPAIVSLGFCSGSFVSRDGLILTNHHCAEGFLGALSQPGADHLADGFTAPGLASELATPDGAIYIVEASVDVSAKVKAALEVDIAGGRDDALARVEKKLVGACERARGRRCELTPFDGGLSWRLIRYLELRDLRVVHAPPTKLGYFGGDADNYEWPRHDGDYALLRARVGPDGRPADPSPDNVPYRPRRWLDIDPTGAQPGETSLVLGFPGETARYMPVEALEFAVRTANPLDLAWYSWVEARLAEEMARSEEAKVRLRATAASLANDRKYTQGIQDNVAATDVLAQRRTQRTALEAWLRAEQSRRTRFDPGIHDLDRLIAAQQAAYPRDHAVDALLQVDRLRAALQAWRWATERELPLRERTPGYLPSDEADARLALSSMESTFWGPLDDLVFLHALDLLRALPSAERVRAVADLVSPWGGDHQAMVDHVFKGHPLDTTAERLALFDLSRKELERSEDPWVKLAIALDAEVLAPRRARDEDWGVRLAQAYPVWMKALQEQQGGRHYPDANGTLRVTWGKVEPYRTYEGALTPTQTWLSELVAKHGLEGREAPASLLAAAPTAGASPWADRAQGDVPVAFVSSVDTTGGNSGSATLNGEGKLIGLVFDGNYESMAADWLYDPALTRTLHVDVRFILWDLSIQPNAAWILAELQP